MLNKSRKIIYVIISATLLIIFSVAVGEFACRARTNFLKVNGRVL